MWKITKIRTIREVIEIEYNGTLNKKDDVNSQLKTWKTIFRRKYSCMYESITNSTRYMLFIYVIRVSFYYPNRYLNITRLSLSRKELLTVIHIVIDLFRFKRKEDEHSSQYIYLYIISNHVFNLTIY